MSPASAPNPTTTADTAAAPSIGADASDLAPDLDHELARLQHTLATTTDPILRRRAAARYLRAYNRTRPPPLPMRDPLRATGSLCFESEPVPTPSTPSSPPPCADAMPVQSAQSSEPLAADRGASPVTPHPATCPLCAETEPAPTSSTSPRARTVEPISRADRLTARHLRAITINPATRRTRGVINLSLRRHIRAGPAPPPRSPAATPSPGLRTMSAVAAAREKPGREPRPRHRGRRHRPRHRR